MPHDRSFKFERKLYFIISALLLMVIVYYNKYIALLGLIIIYAAHLYRRTRHFESRKALMAYLESMSQYVKNSGYQALEELPVGIAIIDKGGKIHWNNKILAEWFDLDIDKEIVIQNIFPDLSLVNFSEKQGQGVFHLGNKYFKIVYKPILQKDNQELLSLLYFTNITASYLLREKCEGAMPVISYIQIDNYDDVLKGLTDSQRMAVLSEVHQKLDEWISELDGVIKKYKEDTYFAIFDRHALDKTLSDKVDILDRIRAIQGGNRIPVTLSIGIAVEEPSISAMGQKAQAGLDLALGRGGDQAAVYIEGKVQFYGGKTKAIEKNTRVKARIIAQALYELIGDADTVLVMGHTNEDYDSLGAAIGVAKMAVHLNKPVQIVVSHTGAAINKLIEIIPEYESYRDIFISPAQAANLVTPATLLFIVDTHRTELTASPDLINIVDRKVVIDHHRRSEDFILNPLLVYLEPSSSSTSELVTELLQYFDDKLDFNRLEATALYAGIIVDTKNFAVQTGVRTFEAAGFLRRAGADPKMVHQLFLLDYSTIKTRSEIIANSETLPGGVVIAVCPKGTNNAQLIAAQAADVLLNIEGIKVSFVLSNMDDGVIISARSNGEVNVQVIMEELGGGGHQTVAGAQIKNGDIYEIKEVLINKVIGVIKESELNESNTTTRS